MLDYNTALLPYQHTLMGEQLQAYAVRKEVGVQGSMAWLWGGVGERIPMQEGEEGVVHKV